MSYTVQQPTLPYPITTTIPPGRYTVRRFLILLVLVLHTHKLAISRRLLAVHMLLNHSPYHPAVIVLGLSLMHVKSRPRPHHTFLEVFHHIFIHPLHPSKLCPVLAMRLFYPP